jgi:hypothetical protein
MAATRRFFTRVREHGPSPAGVITGKAVACPPVLEELAPGAWYHTGPETTPLRRPNRDQRFRLPRLCTTHQTRITWSQPEWCRVAGGSFTLRLSQIPA